LAETVVFFFGAAASALFALMLLGVAGGVVLGFLAYKADIFLFPRLAFFLLEKLRSIFRFMFSFFTRDRFLVERMAVKVLNHVYRASYRRVPVSDRIALLPQCLRDLDCKARLSPELGLACRRCGRCVIDKVFNLFEEHCPKAGGETTGGSAADGKVFVSPGGTFAIRILEAVNPRAVLGVACPRDLFEGMAVCHSLGIPVQGVPLLRTGCVATDVDFEEVSRVLLMESGARNAAEAQRCAADN